MNNQILMFTSIIPNHKKYIEYKWHHSLGFILSKINSFAVALSYFFFRAIYLQAYSIKFLGTPDFWATVLACKTIWPLLMPSIARARKAAKFWASPTVTNISESYWAEGFPRIWRVCLYIGFFYKTPPIVPTEIGNYKLPRKYCSPSF